MSWQSMIPIIGVGLLFIISAVPFILGKIPPNRHCGIRTAKAMSDPKIWYAANRYLGWALAVAGAVILTAGIVLAQLPGLGSEVYNVACLAIAGAASVVASVMSMLHLRAL